MTIRLPIRVLRSWVMRLIIGGCYGMGVFILALTAMTTGWGRLIAWLAGLTAAAGFVFLYERGLTIELSEDGIARVRTFPSRKRTFIPWDSVESVSANLQVILRMGPLGGVRNESHDNRVVLRGAGERLVFHCPLFAGTDDEVSLALSKAGPSAIRRTVEKVRSEGEAELGRIKLDREGLSYGRLVGTTRVGYKDLQDASLEHGSVRLETKRGTLRIPVSSIPNGVYLPKILDSLKGA